MGPRPKLFQYKAGSFDGYTGLFNISFLPS